MIWFAFSASVVVTLCVLSCVAEHYANEARRASMVAYYRLRDEVARERGVQPIDIIEPHQRFGVKTYWWSRFVSDGT